jgi:predicted MFS family arabinose efflux permease
MYRGRFNSIMTIITGTGAAIGALIMGRYIKSYGVRMVWPLVFALTMCSAALMFILYSKERNRKRMMEI